MRAHATLQEEFDAWVRELRANKAAAQQPSSNYGEGRHGGEAKPGATVGGGAGQIGAQEDEDEDNLQFLEGLDDLEASATRMLESQVGMPLRCLVCVICACVRVFVHVCWIDFSLFMVGFWIDY